MFPFLVDRDSHYLIRLHKFLKRLWLDPFVCPPGNYLLPRSAEQFAPGVCCYACKWHAHPIKKTDCDYGAVALVTVGDVGLFILPVDLEDLADTVLSDVVGIVSVCHWRGTHHYSLVVCSVNHQTLFSRGKHYTGVLKVMVSFITEVCFHGKMALY